VEFKLKAVENTFGLYDHSHEKSSCGVGFITRKDSTQSHDLLLLGHQALCSVPHRGGMSSEGVGDGAGVSVDLSINFFLKNWLEILSRQVSLA
jgi:glutamate synthase (NADPH/NADH) large chain